MRDYIISCCSTAALTEEHFKARDISYICFHFELNGKEYADDLGKSIPFDQFYAAMAAGADTKTSQVNAEEFEEYFEPFLKAGKAPSQRTSLVLFYRSYILRKGRTHFQNSRCYRRCLKYLPSS